jgi:Protein of unknown function (DUF664)
MGFSSPLQEPDLPTVAGEHLALASWLDYLRAQLLSTLEGLTDEQAAQRVVGSLTTLQGLVRHLTRVEHVWFVQVLAGLDEPAPFGFPERKDGDFLLEDSDGLAADVASYLAACDRSRLIFAGLSPDDIGHHRRFGDVDARWVMLHMIREYAQHTGHADVIRELIDGTTQS